MEEFQIVKMFYPNNHRKDLALSGRDPEIFNWFECGERKYDPILGMYYFSVSNAIQFYEEKTGITYTAKNNNRLFILSDVYNRSVLCNRYNMLCECTSNRNTLSKECGIMRSDRTIRGVMKLMKSIGYDGIIIKHDPIKKKLNCYDNPVCQNATFYFLNNDSALRPLEKTENCFIVTYSKKNNECIRTTYPDFPDIDEIEQMTQEQDCKETSKKLYALFNDYLKQKSLE